MDAVAASAAEPPGPRRYRFGDVVVDTEAHTVERAGEPQTLEPKAYAVLLALLRRPNQLMARDDLLDTVWGHRHVTPGVLTRAIAQLRHALGDDFHDPRYIRTRHALGYSFIGQFLAEPEVHDVLDAGPAFVAVLPAATSTSGLRAVQGAVFDPATDTAGTAGTALHPARRSSWPQAPSGPDGEERVAAVTNAAAPVAVAGPARVAEAPLPPAQAPPRERREGGRARVRSRSRRRSLRGRLLVAVTGVAALAVAGLASMRAVAPVLASTPSVAVLPFVSVGAGEQDRYFAEGLAVEMHDALAGVPGLQVVDVRRLQDSDRDATVIGRRLHVAQVLDARVRREGDRVRISAWLTDTRTGVTRWSGRFDRDTASVFAVQTEVAQEVVRAMKGMAPGPALARRLAPTHDVAAYDAYLHGLQALNAGDGEAGLSVAVGYFQQAVNADPAFARAQAGICRAELARFEDGLDASAFARADAACARAAAMGPDLREVDLALGELYRTRGDLKLGMLHLRRALDDIALRPAAYVGMARAEAALGDHAAARADFDRALRLQPNDASIHREIGYQAYVAGDTAGAIASYRRATALAPGDERLWSSLGGLYLASGDPAQAATAFERSLRVRPNYAALSNYGSMRYEARDYARAAELYRRAAELDPRDFRIWGNLGDALAASPADAGRAAAAYRHAANLADAYLAIRASDAQALALQGWYRANLGEAASARTQLRRAEAVGTEPGEVAFMAAQTLALLHDERGARGYLARASAAGIPLQRLSASPPLRPLLDVAVAAR